MVEKELGMANIDVSKLVREAKEAKAKIEEAGKNAMSKQVSILEAEKERLTIDIKEIEKALKDLTGKGTKRKRSDLAIAKQMLTTAKTSGDKERIAKCQKALDEVSKSAK